MNGGKRYYGKYRATVVNNADPMQEGRIQVMVPAVSNVALSSWATPCVPIGGLQAGVFVLPQPYSAVWVEFEQGDPDRPIWVGGFWGSAAEIPAMGLAGAPPMPNMVLQTAGQNNITIFGPPGAGIVLSAGPVGVPSSPALTINQAGILLTNGVASIALAGAVVDINKGALTVT
jgi:hypothetical protein